MAEINSTKSIVFPIAFIGSFIAACVIAVTVATTWGADRQRLANVEEQVAEIKLIDKKVDRMIVMFETLMKQNVFGGKNENK